MNELFQEYTKILEKYVEMTRRKFPFIDLLLLTGSVARNTSTQFSDLDIFAVADEVSKAKYPSFIYKNNSVGVGFKSWNYLENICNGENFWSVGAAHILESKIVYSKSEEVKNRFLDLRTELKSNISRSDDYHLQLLRKELQIFTMEEIALLQFHKANNDLLSAKRTVWTVIIFLSKTLARINKTYLTSNWDKNTLEVFKFEILPENYGKKIKALSSTNEFDEMIEITKELKIQTRRLLITAHDELAKKVSPLSKEKMVEKAFYQINGYIQKTRSAIYRRDLLGISYCVAEIQLWMTKLLAILNNLIQIEYQNYFHYNSDVEDIYKKMGYPDLIKSVANKDLENLVHKLNELENNLTQVCTQHNLKLKCYDHISAIPDNLFV